ncbi:Hypothetical_protein [Hexamita inflata]|uniref:Hypothetical_protein n=1 Tax=Hexamita inflata TaxID=28002 RepID=A0AA86VTS4_9EUKA|nr:Hypothetical protein HINF_LOCUS65448 [Hexamita inflata]
MLNNNIQQYKIALSQSLYSNFDDFSAKQVVEKINTLTKEQSIEFWKYYHEMNPQEKLNISRLHFRANTMRILGGDSLTLEDKQYLQQFCTDHTQWSHKETTEYILENYFQNKKDINYWYLYRLVYNCNQRIKQEQITSNNEAREDYRTVYSQTIMDSLTQIYKHGITEILHIDLSDYQQDQICQFICDLKMKFKHMSIFNLFFRYFYKEISSFQQKFNSTSDAHIKNFVITIFQKQFDRLIIQYLKQMILKLNRIQLLYLKYYDTYYMNNLVNKKKSVLSNNRYKVDLLYSII